MNVAEHLRKDDYIMGMRYHTMSNERIDADIITRLHGTAVNTVDDVKRFIDEHGLASTFCESVGDDTMHSSDVFIDNMTSTVQQIMDNDLPLDFTMTNLISDLSSSQSADTVLWTYDS